MAPSSKPVASGPDTTFDGFAAAWEAFFAAIRQARGRATQSTGLTLSQYLLLRALEGGGDLRIGELAVAAEVAPPTATRMLAALEREGIVERRPSDRDGRAITVRLTALGKRRLAAKQKLVDGKRRALYESLSGEERSQAERLLGRLADLVEEL